MSLKILLTGATGFIGSHIAEGLVREGYDVVCLARRTSDLSYIKDLKTEIRLGSLGDVDSIKEVIKDVDIIIHNAGLTKALNKEDYFKVNCLCTKNLLDAAKATLPNLKRFIYVGSQAAAGPSPTNQPIDETYPPLPVSPYGASKLEGEKITLEFGKYFPITVLRPSAVFGPREKDILFYFQTINKGLMPFLGNFNPLISLIYVKDFVQAVKLSIVNDNAVNQIFFVSDNNPYLWSTVAEKIAGILNKRCLKIRVPMGILKIISFGSEFGSYILKKPPLLNRHKIAELSQRYWLCSSKKIQDLLGFKPEFDIDSALKETAEWYKKNKWIK